MEIYRICRTCLNESHTNLVSIDSPVNSDDISMKPEKDVDYKKIANILDDLTENKYNSEVYPYPNKICRLCLNNLQNAFEFKQRCVSAFEKLMKLSDFNIGERYGEINPFMRVDVDVLINENENDNRSEEIDAHFDGGDNTFFDEDESYEWIEPKEENKEYKKMVKNPIAAKKTPAKPSTANDQLRRYPCTECDSSFTRSSHLKRHMTIHTDERAFGCTQCDKRFRRADHLKKHESQHSFIKPHICEQCSKAFARLDHLRNHISNRHTRNPTAYECIDCKLVFETMKQLKRHRKSHNKNEIVCRTCDIEFSTKSELSEHSKVHYKERPFLCTECGMRFVRNDYLIVHMRRHTGEKPFKCKFCSRAFPRNTDLTVHERYHTNDKRHTCPDCGKRFQRAYNLTVHRRTHTGEKPYQCEYCSRRFAQSNDLKSHLRRHTGERFECNICGAQFIQTYLLNHHKKDVHGINTEPQVSRLLKFEPSNTSTAAMPPEFTSENKIIDTDYVKNES